MRRSSIKIGSIIFGLLVVAAGVLLFAFNTGFLPDAYKSIVFSWQMLLIAMGFSFMFSRHKWFGGILLMLIGGFFLLPKLDIEGLDFVKQNGWAIALIVLGIIIIIKAFWVQKYLPWHNRELREKCERRKEQHAERMKNRGNRDRDSARNESGYIDRNYVFGGADEKVEIRNFKGGEINCVFGGMELDLSGSQLAEGVHHLELNSVFGGIVLYVPADWNVEIRQTQVFGHFADNRPKIGFEVDEKSTLIIEASSVFGGGEIKCRES